MKHSSTEGFSSAYEAVKNYLFSLKHHGAKYGIERMALLAAALGHPERRFPIVHIAGTNGKGSTAAMMETIFRRAGYRTGLFTSPHLVYQGERIQVNRQNLPATEVIRLTQHIREVAERLAAQNPEDHPSFFEFMTGMAFLRFAEESVAIGILETGLGGRLDATNIVDPLLSIITTISFDHTEILGDTLTKIAYEKAGIIKPGRPVVLGKLPEEAETEIRRIAKERGSPVFSIVERFGHNSANYPETNLAGDFQRRNAATALLACEILEPSFPQLTQEPGPSLQAVSWPGRWDARPCADGKTLILDATHNPEGAEMLDHNLRKLREQSGRKPIILLGTLGHGRAQALLPVVARHALELHLLRPAQPRACTFEELETCIPPDFDGKVTRQTVRNIIPRIQQLTPGDPGESIVATGSIYLIGELLEALEHPDPVAEQILQD
jgi:dihydrofolate synthase / folylpolyglutamate synthase